MMRSRSAIARNALAGARTERQKATLPLLKNAGKTAIFWEVIGRAVALADALRYQRQAAPLKSILARFRLAHRPIRAFSIDMQP
jgi:hypothetical protein